MESENSYNPEIEIANLPTVEFVVESQSNSEVAEGFSVYDSEGQKAGIVMVQYYPEMHSAEIGYVEVNHQHKKQGYGRAIYKKVIESCKEKGMVLQSSSDISDDAIAVWEGLCKLGLAEKRDNKYYAL